MNLFHFCYSPALSYAAYSPACSYSAETSSMVSGTGGSILLRCSIQAWQSLVVQIRPLSSYKSVAEPTLKVLMYLDAGQLFLWMWNPNPLFGYRDKYYVRLCGLAFLCAMISLNLQFFMDSWKIFAEILYSCSMKFMDIIIYLYTIITKS